MLYRFHVTLNSDSGRHRLVIAADTIDSAIARIMAIEHCPARSIIACRRGRRIA